MTEPEEKTIPDAVALTVTVRKVTKVWTTANGDRVRICDMTDEHLLNAIALCQRTNRDNSNPHDELDESFPLHDDLCNEAIRRGLELPVRP